MPGDSVIKKVIRDVVNEAFDRKLDGFKLEVVGAVREETDKLRGDVAKMRDEIITSNDKVVGELETMRQEQTIAGDKVRLINELDDKVEALQIIHPRGQHAAVI